MTDSPVSVAVIGGSGLYRLFDPASSETRRIATPYGSADVTVGELGGRTVAFLTRHGTDHSVAPHLINYRANIWALASLGVTAILSSAAVGGVDPSYPPGTLVLTDQFIDRTYGRPDTFYDRGSVQHLAAADPFCPTLHGIAAGALADAGETIAPSGTVVVIQGPRFSTRAESLWFRAAGAHTVNMTLYPEVPLASELNIGTVNLSFVTDGDAGLAPPARAAGGASRAPSSGVDADSRLGSGSESQSGSESPSGSASVSAPASASALASASASESESVSVSDELSAELVFARLAEAQPRIIAAIETIIRALPHDYAPRELVPASAVEAVLARETAK